VQSRLHGFRSVIGGGRPPPSATSTPSLTNAARIVGCRRDYVERLAQGVTRINRRKVGIAPRLFLKKWSPDGLAGSICIRSSILATLTSSPSGRRMNTAEGHAQGWSTYVELPR